MDDSQEQIILNTRCKGRDVEYNLVQPSAEYLVLYENTYRMVYMCNKIIIQLCQYNRDDRLMEYSELLEFIDSLDPPTTFSLVDKFCDLTTCMAWMAVKSK